MRDLLLPRTDLAVAVQLVVLALLVVGGAWWARRDRDALRLVLGLGLVLLALGGVRALH